MGEVLPQGNPPKSLRGQPRTPVRLLAHEEQNGWNQCPRHRHRKEKGDDVGSEVRLVTLRVFTQRALGYEPGGHPPKEVFDVLDKLNEIAEGCTPATCAEIGTCADRLRDLLIGGN